MPVPVGQVPPRLGGAYYSPGLVILLSIVTIGVWTFLWSYRTNEDLKKYNGDGIGGVLAVVLNLLLGVVLMFTIPNEIKNMYERDGRESPVTRDLGPVVPASDHRVVHLVLQGPELPQRLLVGQGRPAGLIATRLIRGVQRHRRFGPHRSERSA